MSNNKLEEANAALKSAVETRIRNKDKPSEQWYEPLGPTIGEEAAPKKKERPGSLAFMQILEELRETHVRKSQDYGDPCDPLANIRSGADFVGVEPWRGCLVRVADKIQRIKSFCRDGTLANEGFEDALLDLASYAIIALIMFREGQRK